MRNSAISEKSRTSSHVKIIKVEVTFGGSMSLGMVMSYAIAGGKIASPMASFFTTTLND